MVQHCPILYSSTGPDAWELVGVGDHRSVHVEKIQPSITFLCNGKDDCTKLFKETLQAVPVQSVQGRSCCLQRHRDGEIGQRLRQAPEMGGWVGTCHR